MNWRMRENCTRRRSVTFSPIPSITSVLPSSFYQLEKQQQASEHALSELQSQLQVLP